MTWTPAEIDTLRAAYTTGTPLAIKRLFPGRSWQQIRHRANLLGRTRCRPSPLGPYVKPGNTK
jgi:hypothetical protein